MNNLRPFMIDDFSGNGNVPLMGKSPIVNAKSNSDALKKYLNEKGLNVKVKCSADNNVHFGITPMIFHNGEMLIDGRKRKSWYKIINQHETA